MENRKTIAWIIAGGVAALLAAAVIFAANFMVSFAIGRTTDTARGIASSQVSGGGGRTIPENWQRLSEQTRAWGETVQREQASVQSGDGLTLRGEYALSPEPSSRWLIAVHGYRGDHSHMFMIASFYGLRGYNVLLPDLRGCGASDGDWIGMGWPDRLDMLRWIDWILQRDPDAQIVLHGVSMGGATVLMTSGEKLPPQVKAIVEDCGYTSAWDIFEDQLDAIFHLPPFPIMQVGNVIASMRAGYSFSGASALEQVKKARVPVLFIHGEKDDFVPTEMVYPLYEACASEKQLLVVEGAGHGSSSMVDPELYFGTVFDFVGRYVTQEETHEQEAD